MTTPVGVRPARSSDADELLRWRNDPGTRQASRNRFPVDPTDHVSWLAAVLADPHRLLLIGLLASGEAIGTVRFDALDTPGDFEVSITVAPEARGRGLSLPLLVAAEGAAPALGLTTRLWANVDPGNERSVRLFESAEYQRSATGPSDTGIWLFKPVATTR